MKKFTTATIAFVLFTTFGLISVDTTEARGARAARTHAQNPVSVTAAMDTTAHLDRDQRRSFNRTSNSLRKIAIEQSNQLVTPAPADTPETDRDESTPAIPPVITPDVSDREEVPAPPAAVPPTPKKPEPVVPVIHPPSQPTDETQPVSFHAELSSEIHRLTNLEREKAGLSPLTFDADLAAIAQAHSQDMAQNDYFSHTALSGCTLTCRIQKADYSATAWGENIAWISNSNLPAAPALAQQFVSNWMNSAGHRENILRTNFTHEGIGIAQVGNRVYATANFARPR